METEISCSHMLFLILYMWTLACIPAIKVFILHELLFFVEAKGIPYDYNELSLISSFSDSKMMSGLCYILLYLYLKILC